jgi:hypothetical protein
MADETVPVLAPGVRRERRRRLIREYAAAQAGVVSRAQLYALGVTRGEVVPGVGSGWDSTAWSRTPVR